MEWRKNLYDYEATPPDNAWKNISQELDSDVPAIREALYNYAEVPPQGVWSHIESRLEDPKVVPFFRRYKRSIAYVAASAAVVAGILFFSDLLGTQEKTFSPDLSASVYKSVEPAPVPADSPAADPTDSNISSRQTPVTIQKQPVEATADPRNETRKTIASIQPVRFDPEDDNYIYLTAANGEIKRVSYKFEEMIPEMKKQNSELIRKWKEKLEASSFVPAGSNFFDIAEMVKLLQEEKRP
jgi:hypothetical protein